jgi:RNA polymerase sigma-70 factor (ECF subfamily)
LLTQQSDFELIAQALEGQQKAFKELYDRYVDNLYQFLAQFGNSDDQNEEWTQRAFIKAFHKLHSFKQKSSFKTWLFTIAVNEMRTDMRKSFHFEDIDQTQLPHFEEEEITTTEMWANAKQALRALSPRKRMICLLHIAEGYSHQEIGEMLGISEVASRTTLFRAKKDLRQSLML